MIIYESDCVLSYLITTGHVRDSDGEVFIRRVQRAKKGWKVDEIRFHQTAVSDLINELVDLMEG